MRTWGLRSKRIRVYGTQGNLKPLENTQNDRVRKVFARFLALGCYFGPTAFFLCTKKGQFEGKKKRSKDKRNMKIWAFDGTGDQINPIGIILESVLTASHLKKV